MGYSSGPKKSDTFCSTFFFLTQSVILTICFLCLFFAMSRCTSCKGLFQNPISPPQRFSATEKNTPLRLLSFPDRFFRIFFPEGQQTLEACVIHHRNTRCATHEVCTGKHVKIISTTSKWMLGKQADFPPWVVKAYVNREKKAAYFFQGGCLTNPFQQLSSY